jgi:CubicO group peptidase (beta-lactamase class C family)
MDQIVQSNVPSAFMGSVLVARGTDVLLSKGYGSANLEWNIPNAPNTKFRLGSLTKQFTATSILLLEEREKLKVGDPIKKYLPDAPAAWDKITIYNLLTHTSGIPNFTSFADYREQEPFPVSPEKLVARFRDKPLDFEPGTRYSYSNSGYVLLGYLIERLSGESYEKFVQQNIFDRLGMKDSGYDANSKIIPRRASGYATGPNGPTNAGYIDMTVPFAAGALYSTTEDLLRWEQGLFGGKMLSAASLQKMTTPFKSDYAFGLIVHTVNGRKVVAHNGGIEGFNTVMEYFPDEHLTIIALGNLSGNGPQQVVDNLGALVHGATITLPSERQEITLNATKLQRFVGAYDMGQGPTMLITLEGNQLKARLGNQPALPLFPQAETSFFARAVNAQVDFAGMDAQGRTTQLQWHQNGVDRPGTRMSDADFKRLADAAATMEQRVKDQKPMPGSEAAVRRIIEELRKGEPNYQLMSPQMAALTQQQLPQLKEMVGRLGNIQSITFKNVTPNGADDYLVKGENGALDYIISLGPDGKLIGAGIRPEQ